MTEKIKRLEVLVDKLDLFFDDFNNVVDEIKKSYANIMDSFNHINQDVLNINNKVELTIEKYNEDRKLIHRLCNNSTFTTAYETISLSLCN